MDSTNSKQTVKESLTFLASPIAWALYFTVVYLLVEAACQIGVLRGAVATLTLVLALPTLAVIIYAGYVAQKEQTQSPQSEVEANLEVNPAQMRHFTGEVSIWLSGLFVLLTLATGATALVLQPC